MKIGELSQRTGLSLSRIRYYERIGLLRVVERLPNGYRVYPENAVVILGLVLAAQDAGGVVYWSFPPDFDRRVRELFVPPAPPPRP